MRKAIVLVLALVLAMSLALTAAATPSAGNAEGLPQQTVTNTPSAGNAEGQAQQTTTVITDLSKLTAEQDAEVKAKGEVVKATLAADEEIKQTAYVNGEGEAEVSVPQEILELLQKGEMKLVQVDANGKIVDLKFEIVNGKVVIKNAIPGPIYFIGKK